jgi:hypothetical protein
MVCSKQIVKNCFWGEKIMKKFLITWSISIALFGLAGIIKAGEPFVKIYTTTNSLDLGYISFWSDGISPAVLTVRVESNCVHGPIVASITTLQRAGGGYITPDRISIKTPTTGGFVPMMKPVSISETTEGSHDIKANFKIDTSIIDYAGRYSGSLAFTVMPPS